LVTASIQGWELAQVSARSALLCVVYSMKTRTHCGQVPKRLPTAEDADPMPCSAPPVP
jgi:hypothetical protein